MNWGKAWTSIKVKVRVIDMFLFTLLLFLLPKKSQTT